MGRFQERSIADLLNQTSRLSEPRTTPVIEGRFQMQGPLDELNVDGDRKADVCGDCKSLIEATQAVCCSTCSRTFHNLCLEPLLDDVTIGDQYCYNCKVLWDKEVSKAAKFDPMKNISQEASGSGIVSKLRESEELCRQPEFISEAPKIDTCGFESTEDSLHDSLCDIITKSTSAQPTITKSSTRRKRMPRNLKEAGSSIQEKTYYVADKTEEAKKKLKRCKIISTIKQDSRFLETEQPCGVFNTGFGKGLEMKPILKVVREGDMAKDYVQQTANSKDEPIRSGSSTAVCDGDLWNKEKKAEFVSEILVDVVDCSFHRGEEHVGLRLEERKKLEGIVHIPDQQSRAVENACEGDGNGSKAQEFLNVASSSKSVVVVVSSSELSGTMSDIPSKEFPVGGLVQLSENAEVGQKDEKMQEKLVGSMEDFFFTDVEAAVKKWSFFTGDNCQMNAARGRSMELIMLNENSSGTNYHSKGITSKPNSETDTKYNENEIDYGSNPVILAIDTRSPDFDEFGHPKEVNSRNLSICPVTSESHDLVSEHEVLSQDGSNTAESLVEAQKRLKVGIEYGSSQMEAVSMSAVVDLLSQDLSAGIFEGSNRCTTQPRPDTARPTAAGDGISSGNPVEIVEYINGLENVSRAEMNNSSGSCLKSYFANHENCFLEPQGISKMVISEYDVKVCDICGDSGFEEMLAICSACNEGAEHVYCMQTLLDQVPEGYWLCEGCKFKRRISDSKKSEHLSNPQFITSYHQ